MSNEVLLTVLFFIVLTTFYIVLAWGWVGDSKRWRSMVEQWKTAAKQNLDFSTEQSLFYQKTINDLVSAYEEKNKLLIENCNLQKELDEKLLQIPYERKIRRDPL